MAKAPETPASEPAFDLRKVMGEFDPNKLMVYRLSCTRFLWTRHCQNRNREEHRHGRRDQRDGCGVGAVGSEGERRSSTLSTARDDETIAALAPGQRWSLARKREVVLRVMQGEPVEGLSRRLAVPVWKLERWRERTISI